MKQIKTFMILEAFMIAVISIAAVGTYLIAYQRGYTAGEISGITCDFR